ncbi:MAG: polysaccharide biosynthesis/export family protein [Rikenellaceae bacterium]
MRTFFGKSGLFIKVWLVAALLISISSCASQKEISYLQGIPSGYSEVVNDSYEVRIKPDDLIAIMVNSRDAELAQMFNLPMVSYQTGTRVTGQNTVLAYLVNYQGYIDFPQLGELHVAGLTRDELIKLIKNELIDRGLINDPVVTVQFQNFQVSVVGEVTRPGSFQITSDRISIFDALSMAGDMTIFGQRANVKVIREENGVRTISEVDLRGADILSSPYYYLQQNDVVYVEPNKVRAGQSEINSNRTVGTYASILSVLISIASLFVD